MVTQHNPSGDPLFENASISQDFTTWFDSTVVTEESDSLEGEMQVLANRSLNQLLAVHDCLELLQRVWPHERSTSKIGPFELVSRIGKGGMGTVWKAIQSEPIQRDVAIKFINSEAINPQIVQRFNNERQHLAVLNHANIARIIDAGTTENGRLFYAMELVDGVDLSSFCDNNRLSLNERIHLFLAVCDAIQHAHQTGIIHRDIKPSNVLVTDSNGKPTVKVIDFGLAKLLHSNRGPGQSNDGHNETVSNDSIDGRAIGSLWYMSPEQTGIPTRPIDSRTDVFSLGVLLYQIVTGRVWLDKNDFENASVVDVLVAINERTPISPSERISNFTPADSEAHAENLRESPSRLYKRLVNDLDWIILKTLEKDPAKRYQSVSELAAELRRFLDDRPILIREKSSWYKFKKTIVRNRVASFAVFSLLTVTLSAMCLLSYGYFRISNAERLSAKRLIQTRKSNKVLAGVFDDLNANSLENSGSPFELQVAGKLVTAANQLSDLDDLAEVVDLQTRLARALNSLGQPKDARPICENAYNQAIEQLGMEDKLTRNAGRVLAKVLAKSGEIKRASKTLQSIVDFCENEFGPVHQETLEVRFENAELLSGGNQLQVARQEYMRLLPEMKETFGEDDFRTLDTMMGLATISLKSKNSEQSIEFLSDYCDHCKDVLEKGHPRIIRGLSMLAWAYCQSQTSDKAITFAKEAFALSKQTFGADHAVTYDVMSFVGISQAVNGDLGGALDSLNTSATGLAKTVGDSHPTTIAVRKTLARIYRDSGQAGAAMKIFGEVAVDVEQLQIETPQVIQSLQGLASSFLQAGEYDNAHENLQHCLKLCEPQSHRQRYDTMNQIGECCFSQGKYKDAVDWFRKSRNGFFEHFGQFDFLSTIAVVDLAKALAMSGDTNEAVDLLRDYRKRLQGESKVSRIQLLIVTGQFGTVLCQHGEVETGVKLMEQVVESGVRLKENDYLLRELRNGYFRLNQSEKIRLSVEAELGSFFEPNHAPGFIYLAGNLARLGSELLGWEEFSLAAKQLKKSRTLYATHLPDSWEYWMATMQLQFALMASDESEDFQLLISASEELMLRVEGKLPKQKKEFLRAVEQIGKWLEAAEGSHSEDWRKQIERVNRRLVALQ